jgi:hypothetical protein
MKIIEAIRLMEKSQLEALVWRFNECPLDEVKNIYVPKGKEELVIITYKESTYIPFRLTFSEDPLEIGPEPITLKFHDDYYIFIVLNDKIENNQSEQEKTPLQYFIDFIEKNNLPGILWNFDDCPLEQVKKLENELTIEKDGEIKKAIRCYVILHKENEGQEIIPQNMIEEYEEFFVGQEYKLTIPIIYTEVHHNDED